MRSLLGSRDRRCRSDRSRSSGTAIPSRTWSMEPCGVEVSAAGRCPEAGIAGANTRSEGLGFQSLRVVAEDHRGRVWRWPALVIPTTGRAAAAGHPRCAGASRLAGPAPHPGPGHCTAVLGQPPGFKATPDPAATADSTSGPVWRSPGGPPGWDAVRFRWRDQSQRSLDPGGMVRGCEDPRLALCLRSAEQYRRDSLSRWENGLERAIERHTG